MPGAAGSGQAPSRYPSLRESRGIAGVLVALEARRPGTPLRQPARRSPSRSIPPRGGRARLVAAAARSGPASKWARAAADRIDPAGRHCAGAAQRAAPPGRREAADSRVVREPPAEVARLPVRSDRERWAQIGFGELLPLKEVRGGAGSRTRDKEEQAASRPPARSREAAPPPQPPRPSGSTGRIRTREEQAASRPPVRSGDAAPPQIAFLRTASAAMADVPRRRAS